MSVCLQSRPLLAAAMAALELEARESRDARRLLEILDNLCPWGWGWDALETLNHFQCENGVRSRPALVAVLLLELSAANPVPRSLLH
jgi:hypothetical protein